MQDRLISATTTIDLTYCPADLWSSQAPAQVEAAGAAGRGAGGRPALVRGRQDRGMWNGVGPGFLKYQKGMFGTSTR